MAWGVGWSIMSVAGSWTPNLPDKVFFSSTAPKESRPASIRGCPALTELPKMLMATVSTCGTLPGNVVAFQILDRYLRYDLKQGLQCTPRCLMPEAEPLPQAKN